MPSLRAQLRDGSVLLSTMISEVANPNIARMLKVAGLDSFIVDMEHGIFDYPSMSAVVSLGRALGLHPVVRVPEIRKEPIQRALDAGASGVLVPLARSRADIEHAVSLSRYPPEGERGVATKRPHGDYRSGGTGAYLAEANDAVAVLCQLETAQAFDRLEDLLSVEGLDGVFIGPQDLSVNMGDPDGPWSDSMRQAHSTIAAQARKHDLALGIQVVADEQALAAIELGANYVSCSGDVGMLVEGIGRMPALVRNELDM